MMLAWQRVRPQRLPSQPDPCPARAPEDPRPRQRQAAARSGANVRAQRRDFIGSVIHWRLQRRFEVGVGEEIFARRDA